MRIQSSVVVAVLLFAVAGSANADFAFTFRDLGSLGDTATFTQGINNAGVAVGASELLNGSQHGPVHGFSYTTTMTDLGTLGGSESVAYSINASDQIVGYSADPDLTRHAFLYEAGTMRSLGLPGSSIAYGINDLGQIAGSFTTQPGREAPHAFLYQNGIMTDVSSLVGGSSSAAVAINNKGSFAGVTRNAQGQAQGYAYFDGANHLIGNFGGTASFAASINDANHVAGFTGTHALFYADGVLQDLGTLGGAYSGAFGINNRDQIVGYSTTAPGGNRAVLWQDGQIVDLNKVTYGLGDGELDFARAINDNGQIVVDGRLNGESHGFLLTPSALPSPTPEPSGFILMLTGFLLLGAVGRRRKR